MERRFENRREEVLANCQVPPALFDGMTERLVTFAVPYVERLCRPEQREHCASLLAGAPLGSSAEERRGDRLSPRRGSPRAADLHWHGAVGPSAVAGRAGIAGGPRTGRSGRRAGL